MIGRRATDLFVPELPELYESQDDLVRTTGKPSRGELEPIRHVGTGTYVGLTFARLTGETPSSFRNRSARSLRDPDNERGGSQACPDHDDVHPGRIASTS